MKQKSPAFLIVWMLFACSYVLADTVLVEGSSGAHWLGQSVRGL